MYILRLDGLEWTLVRNDSITAIMPKWVKKFASKEDALMFIKNDVL